MKKSIQLMIAIAVLAIANEARATTVRPFYFANKSSYKLTIEELDGKTPYKKFTLSSGQYYSYSTSSTQFKITSIPTTAMLKVDNSGGVTFGLYKKDQMPTSFSSEGMDRVTGTKPVLVIDVGYRSPANGIAVTTSSEANVTSSYKLNQ
jgi:hypothetical protein